jgi:hypothetical protein
MRRSLPVGHGPSTPTLSGSTYSATNDFERSRTRSHNRSHTDVREHSSILFGRVYAPNVIGPATIINRDVFQSVDSFGTIQKYRKNNFRKLNQQLF